MNTLAEQLASYATSTKYEEIPFDIAHRAKALLIDTLACAIRGFSGETGEIARKIAGRILQCDLPATLWGSTRKSTVGLRQVDGVARDTTVLSLIARAKCKGIPVQRVK